MMDLDYGIPLN
jgi:hypothetical protein